MLFSDEFVRDCWKRPVRSHSWGDHACLHVDFFFPKRNPQTSDVKGGGCEASTGCGKITAERSPEPGTVAGSSEVHQAMADWVEAYSLG
jgi:hypothetical protein